MSRNSKNARKLAKAREITLMHKNGEKGPARTGTSTKSNAWWQKGDYKQFVSGGKKPRTAEAA